MTRIDTWVWAVRFFKTRTLATEAVRAGHVKLNGVSVKPAQDVVVGDTVRIWARNIERVVEVADTPRKRVGAPIARSCYIDRTPERPMVAMPVRDRGAGRPTKKERRQIDRLRGRA